MVLKDKTGKTLSRSEGEAVMKGLGAITISIYAALLAICTLLSASNSSKVLTNNILASDTWAYYQAKSIKQNLFEIGNNLTTDKSLQESYRNNVKRLENDKNEIYASAKKLEEERDEAKKKSPYYSIANALLQIAIVLSSTSILAVSMELLWASIIIGSIGAFLLTNGYWLFIN
jgi:septal ring factor EnvC (AmiA/AmiB activator)